MPPKKHKGIMLSLTREYKQYTLYLFSYASGYIIVPWSGRTVSLFPRTGADILRECVLGAAIIV